MKAQIEVSNEEIRKLFTEAVSREVKRELKLLNLKQIITDVVTSQVLSNYGEGFTDGRFVTSVAKNIKVDFTVEEIAPYITEDIVSKAVSKLISEKLAK